LYFIIQKWRGGPSFSTTKMM